MQTAIREVFDTLEPLAAQKRLEFRLAMPQTPIVIHTDRRALCQIVINLLNNAIKFTEAGEISIRLSRRRAGPAGTVEVVVADSGIGIPPERQSYLFRAFTQLDASSTRRFDGTGLGLYLARELARDAQWRHHGRVSPGTGQPLHAFAAGGQARRAGSGPGRGALSRYR